MNGLGLVVVDRQDIFRTGVAAIVSSCASYRVVKTGKDLNEVICSLAGGEVDILIMGISSQEEFKMCYQLHQLNLNIKTILLIDISLNEEALELIKLGFSGYLLKDTTEERLKDSISQVLGGETPIATEFASQMLSQITKLKGTNKLMPEKKVLGPLTTREQEILKLIVRGISNAAIAGELVITENTVKNHIRNMMQKLKLQNRVQLATYGIESGLKAEG